MLQIYMPYGNQLIHLSCKARKCSVYTYGLRYILMACGYIHPHVVTYFFEIADNVAPPASEGEDRAGQDVPNSTIQRRF